ncbi:hypothetical protein Tco_0204918 [Tanacetum coccineum]
MEFDVPGLVGWLPEGLSDPINCVSRSALARVLFRGLYPDLWISPASKRDSIKICHSLGDAFFSTNTPPLNDELCQFSPPTRPGENTGSSQALTHLNGIHISFVKGEIPWNWTVTLLLHYGEDSFKENIETPSVWSARPAELAAEEIRRTNAARGVQNRPTEDGRVHVVEPRAREALKQKGGGDRRLYSESMPKLDSAKMIIDAGSSDNIASTEMVDQLGLGK